MSGLIFIILLIIFSGLIYFLYKYFDKDGLYLALIISVILSFILSLKVVNISGFDVITYIPVYMAIFVVMYILIEKFKEKDIKKALYLTAFICVIIVLMFVLGYAYQPVLYNDMAINIKLLFVNNFAGIIGFPIVLTSSLIGAWFLYTYTKDYHDHIFVTSCFTAIVVQIIDTLLFSFLSLFKLVSIKEIFQITVMTYSFKLMAMILYIPVLYYTLKLKKVKE